MTDYPTPEPETPEPTPAPAATEEDKVNELLDRLHLEHTENTLHTVWDWAGTHLGWTRPEAPPGE